MKKILSLLILSLTISLAFSQDNIVLKNGDEINAKILEVGELNIKYKKFSNLDGPVFTKSKNEIFYIKYSNGEKEIFKNIKNKLYNNTVSKKVLVSGSSNFSFSNSGSSSSFSLNSSVGGFLTENFVLGGSLVFQSFSLANNNAEGLLIGPFIRGYINDFYTQVNYEFMDDVNYFSAGVGYQIFLDNNNNVSLNPKLVYSVMNSGSFSVGAMMLKFAFEFHL